MPAAFLEPLKSFPSRLLTSIHGIAEEDLRIVEREAAWSILDVIAHLGDFELLTAWRLRLMGATERPVLPGVTQEAFVTELHQGRTQASLVRDLTQLRAMNVALIERFTEQQLERTGEHPHYGTLSIRQLLERATEHQEKHLGQIERIARAHGLRRTIPNARGESVVVREVTPRQVAEGVRVHDLWRDGQRHAQYIEIDPGAKYPGVDLHVPGPEVAFVVSGTFQDGVGEFGPGTFLHYAAGSSHVPQSESGCALFLFYPEG